MPRDRGVGGFLADMCIRASDRDVMQSFSIAIPVNMLVMSSPEFRTLLGHLDSGRTTPGNV